MTRHSAPFTKADIRRAREAAPGRVIEIVGKDGTVIRLVPARAVLPEDGQARNASGYVEARLADAPWARSK
jgi:hypothetical protein